MSKYLDEQGLSTLVDAVRSWVEDDAKAASAKTADTATSAGTAAKLGTETVGDETHGVWLDSGVPKATTGGVGSGAGPMAFEVRPDGHLWVVYDDGLGEPDLYVNDQGHLVWRYETQG